MARPNASRGTRGKVPGIPHVSTLDSVRWASEYAQQYVIETDGATVFQSYDTPCAVLLPSGRMIVDVNARAHSRATTAALNRFIKQYGTIKNVPIELDLHELGEINNV